MNKRMKRKRRKMCFSTSKQRRRNKALCERYPFLIPRNVWTDKIAWNKDCRKYSYTLAEDFPRGWWKAFGQMMCKELKDDLIRCHYLKEFRVEQIKEKYGELRFYYCGVPIESDCDNIINKYSALSRNICVRCGRPDVPMINYYGWISPYCEDCVNKIQRRQYKFRKVIMPYEKFLIKGSDNNMMVDKLKFLRFSKDGTKYIEIDISDTTQKIRERYNERSHR